MNASSIVIDPTKIFKKSTNNVYDSNDIKKLVQQESYNVQYILESHHDLGNDLVDLPIERVNVCDVRHNVANEREEFDNNNDTTTSTINLDETLFSNKNAAQEDSKISTQKIEFLDTSIISTSESTSDETAQKPMGSHNHIIFPSVLRKLKKYSYDSHNSILMSNKKSTNKQRKKPNSFHPACNNYVENSKKKKPTQKRIYNDYINCNNKQKKALQKILNQQRQQKLLQTTTSTNNLQQQTQPRQVQPSKRTILLKANNNRIPKDSWMCCFCGATFNSFRRASAHEQTCIYSFDFLQNILYYSKSIEFGNRKFKTITNNTKKRIVLTDEALHKAYTLLGRKIISYEEADAERELALMRRDRRYYDTLRKKRFKKESQSTNGDNKTNTSKNNISIALLAQQKNSKPKKGEDEVVATEGKEEEQEEQQEEEEVTKSSVSLLKKLKKKFHDAYLLMKEEDMKRSGGTSGIVPSSSDQVVTYSSNDAKNATKVDIHDENTIYINVLIRNSIKFVKHEMDRVAKLMWTEYDSNKSTGGIDNNQFDKIRALVQLRVVEFVQIALSTDFTPKAIALQLATDLNRLMKPQLEHRGINIETEVEYRQGAFFILAVNIKSINWLLFLRFTHFQLLSSTLKSTTSANTTTQTYNKAANHYQREGNNSSSTDDYDQNHHPDSSSLVQQPRRSFSLPSNTYLKKPQRHVIQSIRNYFQGLFPSIYEAIACFLFYLYYFHSTISISLCYTLYNYLGLKVLIQKYILISVTDDILQYVERKGMETSVQVLTSEHQAPFMLEVVRELRLEEQKKKRKKSNNDIDDANSSEGSASSSTIDIIGPLLGKAFKLDKESIEPLMNIPESLEMEGLDITLHVGYRRLRWAMLHCDSKFVTDAVWKQGSSFENIKVGKWSVYPQHIGSGALPDGINEEDFIEAQREQSYLMPKNAFVKANTAYETLTIKEYNDSLFVMKSCTRTPEVPFGTTFLAWTQYIVINLGKDMVRIIFSMEVEYPNGAPMVARQIKSGLRSGATEGATLFTEYVIAYASVFP